VHGIEAKLDEDPDVFPGVNGPIQEISESQPAQVGAPLGAPRTVFTVSFMS